MFATRYFPARYFCTRYFAKVGADPAPVTGGVVWVVANGVITPPARQTSGTQLHWMVSNGLWIVPTVKPAPRPRSFSKDRR